jgi:hypothetical protein
MNLSDLAGRPVLDLATATNIGKVADFVIDPVSRRIVGFQLANVKGPAHWLAWDAMNTLGARRRQMLRAISTSSSSWSRPVRWLDLIRLEDALTNFAVTGSTSSPRAASTNAMPTSARRHCAVSRADVQRVDDMLEVTVEIAAIVERGRGAYDRDVALRRAIERCLEILGED